MLLKVHIELHENGLKKIEKWIGGSNKIVKFMNKLIRFWLIGKSY